MVIMHLYRHLSIALYYISLLFGLGNDDQNRNPNIRYNLVVQPPTHLVEVIVIIITLWVFWLKERKPPPYWICLSPPPGEDACLEKWLEIAMDGDAACLDNNHMKDWEEGWWWQGTHQNNAPRVLPQSFEPFERGFMLFAMKSESPSTINMQDGKWRHAT